MCGIIHKISSIRNPENALPRCNVAQNQDRILAPARLLVARANRPVESTYEGLTRGRLGELRQGDVLELDRASYVSDKGADVPQREKNVRIVDSTLR